MEERMIMAVNVLIEAQKRTQGFIETVIDKYSRVDTEITKINRRLISMHEQMQLNHLDVLARFGAVDIRLNEMDHRLDRMDHRLDGIDSRLDGIDGRLDGMDSRFDKLDARLDRMEATFDARFAAVENRLDAIDSQLQAIVTRLDEADRVGDERAAEMRRMHIEISGQYNDLLTAMQLAHNSMIGTRDFGERLEQVEKKLGLK